MGVAFMCGVEGIPINGSRDYDLPVGVVSSKNNEKENLKSTENGQWITLSTQTSRIGITIVFPM